MNDMNAVIRRSKAADAKAACAEDPSGGEKAAVAGIVDEGKRLFSYSDTFEGFSPEEIRTIAEVKRFLECYEGDRHFRKAADEGGRFTDEQRRMLKDIGRNVTGNGHYNPWGPDRAFLETGGPPSRQEQEA